jgi:hypothetical protein
MQVKQDTVNRLGQIQYLLQQADALFCEIPREEQNQLLAFHNETSSLNHALRWGPLATCELLAACKEEGLLPELPKAEYVQEVNLPSGESLDIYREQGGGLVGIDSAFLDQVGSAFGPTENEDDPIILQNPINGGVCLFEEPSPTK